VVKVNTHEAKTHLSRLLERVANGEEIVIAKAGKPVAKLVPYTETQEPRKLGTWTGKVWLAPDWDSTETNSEIEKLFYSEDDESEAPA
jgi:prevent-host-death family protein